MSCQVRLIAHIKEIDAIRRCLFPTDDQRGTDSWLQQCKISHSPTGDLIAVANERKIVVLTSKWDSESSLSQFLITFSGCLHEYDKVKALLCLPVVGSVEKKTVGIEWTCLLVGFDSGHVRCYTETCELLFEEQFHAENITTIKCQSQHNPRSDISPNLYPEEIYVQYQNSICVLNGPELFLILRNSRSKLEKDGILDNSHIIVPKKWGFQDQSIINDSAVVGLSFSNIFDHLFTVSTCGGFDSKYKAMPPYDTLVLAAGSKPFLGYYYASEGGMQPILSDVARAVASKLKSALPDWLTGTKSQPEKQISLAMQPPDPMAYRFGLCDLERTSTDLILSPDRKLAAVCDALGRVLLVDSHRGITLKIFKGYRDAQCSFTQVLEEKDPKKKTGNKVACFLNIYSPRKGTLEIFSVQLGTRIATFTASKNSRLLYINYGIMGFTTTAKSRYICQYTTIFIDNDGQVKEISIPFHFALSEKNNKRARDIHLYRKFRHLVKSDDVETEKLLSESVSTCTELKTLEFKSQTVDILLGTKSIPATVSLECLQILVNNLVEEEEQLLKARCENASVLLKLFLFVTNLAGDKGVNSSLMKKDNFADNDVENSTLMEEDNLAVNEVENSSLIKDTLAVSDVENSNSTKKDKLAVNEAENSRLMKKDNTLHIDEREMANLQKLFDLSALNYNTKLREVHVSFSEETFLSPAEFLSVFDISRIDGVCLKENVNESILYKTSETVFKPYVTENHNLEELEIEIIKTGLPTENVFNMLINYWVNRPLHINPSLEKEMRNLSKLIHTLVKTADKEVIRTEYNEVSTFWNKVRDLLVNSARPFPALIAAILCKGVAQSIDAESQSDESSASLDYESMEVLTQETVEWSLLIGQLEDVSLLNIILSTKLTVQACPLPKLKHDNIDVSLKYILQKGRGVVTELAAQWITSTGFNPDYLIMNDALNKSDSENSGISDPEGDDFLEREKSQFRDVLDKEKIIEQINLLKTKFPYSLESSSLLANMAWEYALAWRKDIQDLKNLAAAVRCLSFIQDIQIKQGIHQLVWNTHLKIVNENACKLINKVGKVPKERLCKQDTGLSDQQLKQFIGISMEFLGCFLTSAYERYNAPETHLVFESIWENEGLPLAELAIQQREVNYELLHSHYQLGMVLHIITTVPTKCPKFVNTLFDASVVNLFFTDLQRKCPVNLHRSDTTLNESREQFLLSIITASLESITVDESGKIYSTEHVKCMSECTTLATIWNLDVDILKRHQVVQLFSRSYDDLADELIPGVRDKAELGRLLLKVAAKRLSYFIASAPKLKHNFAAMSTTLSGYLRTLDGERCTPSPLKNITYLASRTFWLIDEGQKGHRLAESLLDTCRTLENIHS